MCSGSVVASMNPWAVSGSLRPGRQGDPGPPWRAEGAEGGGELPVTGPVYLFDPAPELGQRLLAGLAGQLPPRRRRSRLVGRRAVCVIAGRVRVGWSLRHEALEVGQDRGLILQRPA